MNGNKIVSITSGVVLVFLVGLILRLAKPVFFPFFLAIFFYFILSPALDFMTRLKIPKAIALALVIVVTFSSLYLLGVLIYSSAKGFVGSFPQYGEKISRLLNSISEKLSPGGVNVNPWSWTDGLDVNRIASFLLASLNQFLAVFSSLVLIFVFLIFMLAGRGKLSAKVEKSFSAARADKINQVIENIDSQVQKYLVIKTGISVISGVIAGTVLALFGVNFAIVFGFLTFILNFIPSLGSIIAISFSALMAAFQFGRYWPALWIFIILISLDILMANFVEPKWMGRGLGLSPLAVLFSLFFWGWLWGIPGMILAVPIMAIVKIICGNIPSLEFIAELISK
jgi:predicted PurR-regulated permease PerM